MSQLLQSSTLQGQTAAPHNHPTPCRATSPLAVPMEPPAYITNHQLTNGVTLHNTSGTTSFLTANGVGSTHKFRVAVDSHVPRKATHAPSHLTLHWPVDLTANGRTYSTCWVQQPPTKIQGANEANQAIPTQQNHQTWPIIASVYRCHLHPQPQAGGHGSPHQWEG